MMQNIPNSSEPGTEGYHTLLSILGRIPCLTGVFGLTIWTVDKVHIVHDVSH